MVFHGLVYIELGVELSLKEEETAQMDSQSYDSDYSNGVDYFFALYGLFRIISSFKIAVIVQ